MLMRLQPRSPSSLLPEGKTEGSSSLMPQTPLFLGGRRAAFQQQSGTCARGKGFPARRMGSRAAGAARLAREQPQRWPAAKHGDLRYGGKNKQDLSGGLCGFPGCLSKGRPPGKGCMEGLGPTLPALSHVSPRMPERSRRPSKSGFVTRQQGRDPAPSRAVGAPVGFGVWRGQRACGGDPQGALPRPHSSRGTEGDGDAPHKAVGRCAPTHPVLWFPGDFLGCCPCKLIPGTGSLGREASVSRGQDPQAEGSPKTSSHPQLPH